MHHPEGLGKYSSAKRQLLRGQAAWMSAQDCPHRYDVQHDDGRETAQCQRLAGLIGSSQRRLCEVSRDACDACVRAAAPTRSGINPVFASLLHHAASELQRAASHGSDLGHAAKLLKLAEDNLACHYPETAAIESAGQTEVRGGGPNGAAPRLAEAIPPMARRADAGVATWAVGVTTAPRQQPTLDRCLDNLRRAGWQQPQLFVDGGAQLADRHGRLDVTYREQKVGAWANFYLAMIELLMRQPHADAYLLLQDDALLFDGENVREYLQGCLWPDGPVAAVSLYCPASYTRRQPGWYSWPGTWVWGALAFVFDPAAARQFVSDPLVIEHRWQGRRGDAQVDVVIGRWAQRQGKQVHYCVPSLVQHIGQTSTLWPAGQASGARAASWFIAAPPLDGIAASDEPQGEAEPAGRVPTPHQGAALSKLAVVTSTFAQPPGSVVADNFTRFAEDLRAHGIELFTVEGVQPGTPPMLGDAQAAARYELPDLLWQKERLLNLAIAALPADVDAVGWFDADLLFRHDNFQQAILTALQRSPLIQPWRYAEWLDAQGRHVPWARGQRWRQSLAAVNWSRPRNNKVAAPHLGHPGLAWAARRQTLDAIGGLYDHSPLGGGDTIMAIGFWGDWTLKHSALEVPSARQRALDWGRQAFQVVQGNVGFLEATVSHLWHGPREARKYTSRHRAVNVLGIDPSDYLQRADNGTWRWSASAPPQLVQYVAQYFTQRRRALVEPT